MAQSLWSSPACSTSSPPSTPTRWPPGGSARDHLSLRSSPALLSLHLGRLRHHPAHRAPHDDPLRRLLFRPLRRRHHRRKLGDVVHQTLNVLGPNQTQSMALQSHPLCHRLVVAGGAFSRTSPCRNED